MTEDKQDRIERINCLLTEDDDTHEVRQECINNLVAMDPQYFEGEE